VTATLFTFGYEGLSIGTFIARLRAARVAIVLDVRELPLSRKAGFSKRSFAKALNDAGLVYAHLPELGCPRQIRERYKANGDWRAYSKEFRTYLAKQSDAVADLVRTANKSRACLVCFEADFNRCHRTIVAHAAVRAGGPSITHLTLREAVLVQKVA
jgi:uncharacterized protein (DUF488 family)